MTIAHLVDVLLLPGLKCIEVVVFDYALDHDGGDLPQIAHYLFLFLPHFMQMPTAGAHPFVDGHWCAALPAFLFTWAEPGWCLSCRGLGVLIGSLFCHLCK